MFIRKKVTIALIASVLLLGGFGCSAGAGRAEAERLLDQQVSTGWDGDASSAPLWAQRFGVNDMDGFRAFEWNHRIVQMGSTYYGYIDAQAIGDQKGHSFDAVLVLDGQRWTPLQERLFILQDGSVVRDEQHALWRNDIDYRNFPHYSK